LRPSLIVALVVAGATLRLPAPAAVAAGLDAKDKAELKEATRFYKQGQYEAAAKLLTNLVVDHPEMSNLLRNLGACYYYLRRPEPALSNLRDYLARKQNDIAPEDRQEVERWIDEMEKLRAQNAAAPAVSPAAAPVPAVPAVPSPTVEAPAAIPAPIAPAPSVPVAEPAAPPAAAPFPEPAFAGAPAAATATWQPAVPSESVVAAAAPPSAAPGRGLRVAGIACGVVGLASIGTGIYFYTRASHYSDKVSDATKWNSTDYDAGKSAVTMQWVFYGIGGGALATGTVLYLLGLFHSESPASVSMTPMVGPGIAGLSARGGF
jgi:tetratricopeptide (TPR) repeat protein